MKYHIAWFGKMTYDVRENVDAVQTLVESAGHELVMIHDPEFVGTPTDAATAKDNLFLNLASTTPDGIFLDADCQLFGFFEMQPGRPYFEVLMSQPHIGYFAVNGCCNFFRNLLAERKLRNIVDCYGFTNKLLRDKLCLIYPIPDESFHHEMVTHKQFFKGRT